MNSCAFFHVSLEFKERKGIICNRALVINFCQNFRNPVNVQCLYRLKSMKRRKICGANCGKLSDCNLCPINTGIFVRNPSFPKCDKSANYSSAGLIYLTTRWMMLCSINSTNTRLSSLRNQVNLI